METLNKAAGAVSAPEQEEKLTVRKSSERYIKSYWRTFDCVAREGKFLSISEGYPIKDLIAFIRGCRECGYPQYLLVNERKEAVGWCDIVRRTDEPDDVGFLGVGILKEYRHRGLGSLLMRATIDEAMRRGFREIRLEVRTSNHNAIRSYRRLGFVKIALRKDGVVTDGAAEDVWVMSLSARELPPTAFRRRGFFAAFPQKVFRFRPDKEATETATR